MDLVIAWNYNGDYRILILWEGKMSAGKITVTDLKITLNEITPLFGCIHFSVFDRMLYSIKAII